MALVIWYFFPRAHTIRQDETKLGMPCREVTLQSKRHFCGDAPSLRRAMARFTFPSICGPNGRSRLAPEGSGPTSARVRHDARTVAPLAGRTTVPARPSSDRNQRRSRALESRSHRHAECHQREPHARTSMTTRDGMASVRHLGVPARIGATPVLWGAPPLESGPADPGRRAADPMQCPLPTQPSKMRADATAMGSSWVVEVPRRTGE